MMPAEVAALMAIVDKVGALPLGGVLLAIVVGPWIMAFLLARGQERRFEAVSTMYRDNAKLVEQYHSLCQRHESREADLRELVRSNTAAMVRLTDIIDATRRASN